MVSRSSETSPLIDNAPQQARAGNVTFYLTSIIGFLMSAGSAIAVPPTTSILQDVLCERYYSAHGETQNGWSLDNVDCKAEPIQVSLTMIRGISTLLLLLPGVVLVVPFSALAEHWGIKRVMLLSLAGILLAECWFDLVCWYGRTWQVRLVYLSPAFYLLGGGPTIAASLLFVLVANATPAHLRPSRFFLLEACAYIGYASGYMASSLIMDKSVWAPVLLGLGLLFMMFWFVLPLSDEKAPLPSEEDQQESDISSKDTAPKSLLHTLLMAVLFLKDEYRLVILLSGYLLRALGVGVMRLMIVYAAQVFDWSFSRAGYLPSLDGATHLVVLLVLPSIDHFLLARDSPSSSAKDLTLARGSVLLSAIGCAGMALAPSPPLLVTSIVVYGLGGGYTQSIRAVLTASTSPDHRAIVYSFMGMMETLGTLVGALLWPLVYQVGLRLGGPWIGLPFMVTGGLYGVVYLTLLG